MRTALSILCLALLTAAVAASAAAAQVPAPEPRIRAGVTVSGVDVGNLTLAEAQLRLEQTLGPVLAQGITVTAAGQSATLPMAPIDFVFHADETALRALKAGQKAPAAPTAACRRPWPSPRSAMTARPSGASCAGSATGSKIEARDATIKIRLTRISRRRHHRGRRLAVPALMKSIKATLKDPLAVRQIAAGVETVLPAVRKSDLRRVYRRVITIDRSGFRLRLFKKLRFLKGYGVAVGMPAYPTPTGLFALQSKQVNPTWTAPNSPWAGEMAGQQVAGGAADNPLKARWMGVDGAVGIHGTGQPWTIGTRASHGCIRMTVPDVIDLFRRVSIGTPVLIR